MYVCICHGVTDKKIEQTIEQGATTMKLLTNVLNVGSSCGKCCSCAKKLLNNKLLQISVAELAVA